MPQEHSGTSHTCHAAADAITLSPVSTACFFRLKNRDGSHMQNRGSRLPVSLVSVSRLSCSEAQPKPGACRKLALVIAVRSTLGSRQQGEIGRPNVYRYWGFECGVLCEPLFVCAHRDRDQRLNSYQTSEKRKKGNLAVHCRNLRGEHA